MFLDVGAGLEKAGLVTTGVEGRGGPFRVRSKGATLEKRKENRRAENGPMGSEGKAWQRE